MISEEQLTAWNAFKTVLEDIEEQKGKGPERSKLTDYNARIFFEEHGRSLFEWAQALNAAILAADRNMYRIAALNKRILDKLESQGASNDAKAKA